MFWRDFVTQLFVELHTTPAVTQRAMATGGAGCVTADNVFVQFMTISRGSFQTWDPYALDGNSSMVWKWIWV